MGPLGGDLKRILTLAGYDSFASFNDSPEKIIEGIQSYLAGLEEDALVSSCKQLLDTDDLTSYSLEAGFVAAIKTICSVVSAAPEEMIEKLEKIVEQRNAMIAPSQMSLKSFEGLQRIQKAFKSYRENQSKLFKVTDAFIIQPLDEQGPSGEARFRIPCISEGCSKTFNASVKESGYVDMAGLRAHVTRHHANSSGDPLRKKSASSKVKLEGNQSNESTEESAHFTEAFQRLHKAYESLRKNKSRSLPVIDSPLIQRLDEGSSNEVNFSIPCIALGCGKTFTAAVKNASVDMGGLRYHVHAHHNTKTSKSSNDSSRKLSSEIKRKRKKSAKDEDERKTFCRSCFIVLRPRESQLNVEGGLLDAFEDLTQQIVSPFYLTPTFCEECSNNIMSLSDFKKLTLLKQKKFQFLLERNKLDEFDEIYEMELDDEKFDEFDDFSMDIKSEPEPEDQVVVKVEPDDVLETFDDFVDEDYEPPKVKSTRTKQKVKSEESNLTWNEVEKLEHNNPVKHPYRCDFCSFSSTQRLAFEIHMNENHNPVAKVFDCKFCEFSTAVKSLLSAHRKLSHSQDVNGYYTCHICDKKVTQAASLRAHIRNIHLKERNVLCTVCGKKFFDNLTMK